MQTNKGLEFRNISGEKEQHMDASGANLKATSGGRVAVAAARRSEEGAERHACCPGGQAKPGQGGTGTEKRQSSNFRQILTAPHHTYTATHPHHTTPTPHNTTRPSSTLKAERASHTPPYYDETTADELPPERDLRRGVSRLFTLFARAGN